MRRSSAFLALVVLGSLLAVPAAQAASVGGACKKVGSTAKSGSTPLVCVKQGKKLVWAKAKQSAPIALPRPTPTPTPTPTKELTLAEKWKALGSSALEPYERYALEVPGDPVTAIDAEPAPGLPRAIWDPALATMKRTVAFWDRFHKPSTKVFFNVGLLSDSEWICKQVASRSQFRKGSYCVDSHIDEGKRIAFVARMYESEGGHTGVQYENISPSASGSNLYQVVDERVFRQTEFLPRIEHEYVHQIQWDIAGPKYVNTLPCWILEGGAEYLGILTSGAGDVAKFLFMRENTSLRGDLRRFNFTQQGFRDFLLEATKNSKEVDCFTQTPYGVYRDGVLANEWLVLKLGIPGYFDLMKEATRTDWKSAVEKTFSKPYIEVLDQIAQHMYFEAKLIKENDQVVTIVECDRPYAREPKPAGCYLTDISRSAFKD